MIDFNRAIEMLRYAGYKVEYQEEDKYYAIIGGYSGLIIGKCTASGRLDVLEEEPYASFVEITKEEYEKE